MIALFCEAYDFGALYRMLVMLSFAPHRQQDLRWSPWVVFRVKVLFVSVSFSDAFVKAPSVFR